MENVIKREFLDQCPKLNYSKAEFFEENKIKAPVLQHNKINK